MKTAAHIAIDTLNLKYVWDFGEGGKASGDSVKHCFPGPGKYKVKLDIYDKVTGNLFFSKLEYEVDFLTNNKPFIKSPDFCLKGDSILFDASTSLSPGSKIINYSWNFGDGTTLQGKDVSHSFVASGEFMVNLVLTIKSGQEVSCLKQVLRKKLLS